MNVGELAAYLTLDDTQFQSKLGNAKGGLSGLGTLAKGAGQAVATALTAGTTAATAMAVSLVKTGVSYNVLQQNSRAALTTLLGSQTAVNAQMEKLNELTSRSPFGKDIFIQAQQQLISFGMAAEKVVPTLDAVQNAVAATGGSSQQLSEITFVLAQIQAAGKITGQDLMQLGQRGIDAATLMGNSLGKSGAEIRKDITAGTLDAGTAIDALVEGMTAKFGGATDLIKQQWSGATDRIKAAWRDTGSIIAEPFIDPNGGGQAVIWANLVADTMRSVQTHVTTAMAVIEGTAGPTFDRITNGLETANAKVKAFDMAGLLGQISALGKYTPLISSATTALLTLGLKPVPGLGKLAEGMGPVLVGVTALIASSPELRKVGTAFTDALAPAVPQLQQAATGAADLAMQVISALAPGLTKAATGAGDFLADLAPLAPMMVDAAGAAVPLVSAVADLAGWVLQLPTPLLAAVTALVAFHGPLGSVKTGILGLGDPLKSFGSSVGSTLSGAKAAIDLFSEGWVNARANGVPNMKAIAQTAGEVGSAMTGGKSLVAGFGSAVAGLLTPANLVGAGLTILTGIVAMYAAKKAEAKRQTDDFRQSLNEETGAITENTESLVAKRVADSDAADSYQDMGGNVRDLTEAILGNADAQERVNGVLDAYAEKQSYQGQTNIEALNAIGDVNKELGTQKGQLADAQAAQEEYNAASLDGSDAAQQQADSLADLIDKQREAAGVAMSADEAQGKWNEQLADNADVLQKLNGYTDEAGNAVAGLGTAVTGSKDAWDLQSEAGRLANDTMLDTASRAWDVIDSLKQQGATQEELSGSMVGLRKSFVDTAIRMGMNETAANRLADTYLLIPSEVSTNITAFDKASGIIKSIRTTLDGLPRSKTITVYTDHVQLGSGPTGMTARRESNGGVLSFYKDGGLFDPRVVKAFANGGEHHVAQIAPAGAYRLWAEPETGGEGYVPLAQSKRARSEQIMGELANRMDGMYIPARALRRADGAVDGGSVATMTRPSPAATIVHLNATIDAHDLEGLRSVEQFMQAIGYQQRMNGLGGGY